LKNERIKAIAFRAAVIVVATLAYPAYAQYEVAEIPFFNTPKGTAALGGGLRLGQDLYIATDNEDQRQYDLVPLYLYNGKYVFFRGTAGGIHLFSTDNIELNVMGRYRFTKLDPDRNAFFEGIEERKQTLDGGVELRLRGGWGIVNANYLTRYTQPAQGPERRGVLPLHLRSRAFLVLAVHHLGLERQQAD
jgi:hypothetical protein